MKRILITVLLTAFFVSPLCAQELTGTLQQIQKTGKIKIGYRQSSPPMSFMDSNETPAGYSIDLCKQVVAEVEKAISTNVTIEYIPVTTKNRFDALTDNKIDILCGATTKTMSRAEIVDFTQLTFVTGASFMTLKGKKIRNNFDGKNIGVKKGSTTADALRKLFEEAQIDAKIVLLDSATEALEQLEKEKIDAFASDQIVLIGLALSTAKPGKFTVLSDLFSYEPFALAVRRNDADFRLVADRVISGLYRSKQILKLYDQWIGPFSSSRPSAFEALVELNAIPE